MLGNKSFSTYSCIVLFVVFRLCQNVTSHQLRNYLTNLQVDTNTRLKDLIEDRQKAADFEFDINFQKALYFTLSDRNASITSVSIFDSDCIFLGDQIYNVTFGNNSFALEKSSEKWFSFPESVNLVRAIKYSNFSVLLVSVSGHSNVYIRNNVTNEWVLVQKIATTNNVPDARFFTNRDQLYLLILNSEDSTISFSKIYKWTGAHFDEIDKFKTKNAVQVSSFLEKQSEIILVLQKQKNESAILIFEFNKDTLKQSQLIINNCSNFVTYVSKGKQYLAVLEKHQTGILYRWNGIEFAQVGKLDRFPKVEKVLFVYTDNVPVIFVFEKGEMSAFYHFGNQWQMINKVNLKENIDILGITIMLNRNTSALLAFYKDEESIGYLVLPFEIRVNEIGGNPQLNEVVKCLLSLEALVKNYTVPKNLKKTNLHSGENQKSSDTLLSSAAHSVNKNVTLSSLDLESGVAAIEQRIKIVNERLHQLRQQLDSRQHTLMGNLTVKGNLHVNQMTAKEFFLKHVNGVEWNTSWWLSYTKPQVVTGSVIAKNLIGKNLSSQKDTRLLDDLLFRNKNQNVTGKFHLNSLKANNIYLQKINDIDFDDVYLRSSPSVIRGTKHFDVLNVNDVQIGYLNKDNVSNVILQLSRAKSNNYLFSSSMNIENLNFDEINGMVWNVLKDSVFRVGTTNRITGSLTINSVKCNSLQAKNLGDINASSLLTTKTNQTIKSMIHWTHILSHGIKCNKINNVSFSDVAVAGRIIKSPVSIDKTRVNGNLYINYPEGDFNENLLENHIIGTDVADLVQRYNKPVKILGNLHLKNVIALKGARIVVNGQYFDEDVISTYWSKSKFQNIPFFEAQNGITTSHISTAILNKNPIDNYLTNDLEDKLPIKWVFKNALITGNVQIDQSMKHKPDLQEIDLVSVKRNGRFRIANKLTVQGNVRIKHLVTNYLDDVKLSETMNTETSAHILSQNTFEKLLVKGDVISNLIRTETINDINLQELDSAVLQLARNEQIQNLWSDKINIQNGSVTYLNKNDFNDYVKNLNDLYEIKTVNTITVNGKVNIRDVEDLILINGCNIEKLEPKNLEEHVFADNVKILGSVSAETVEVVFVNYVNFSQLLDRVLFRDWEQNITGFYTFDQVNAPNIFVPKINDVVVRDLINTQSTEHQTLIVPGMLHLSGPKFLKSLNAKASLCDIQRVVGVLQNPPSTYWDTIRVSQNVTLWDHNCLLNTIMTQSVHAQRNNVIYGQVTFDHHIFAKDVIVKKLINGVYLNDLFNDAVLKDVPEQLITGKKRFHKLSVASAISEAAYIPFVNEIDIKILNESILDNSNIYNTVIRGPKLFYGGLEANRLITNTISNLDPQSFVSLNTASVIPKAYFYHIHVDQDLDVGFVNNVNFSYFMAQRLLRDSEAMQIASGTYFFDRVALIGNTNLPSINNVFFDELVLDEGVQVINAPKYFSNNISIDNNLEIRTLNGEDLLVLYNNSILLGQDNSIKGSLKFSNVSSFANIETEKLNGISISDMEDYIRSASPIIQNDVIRDTMKKMGEEIKTSVKLSKEMSDHYLYLEKSNELQIFAPNISRAYAYTHQGVVMLFLTKFEKGKVCGLDNACPCPIQEVLQITNEKSIQTIAPSNRDRVFSYEGDDASVHLVTNGISTSETCRKNSSAGFNETTLLMWITFSSNGAVDHNYYPENLEGYISGVEYFDYNGSTYVVIARFYEPNNNTRAVPCLIMKISKEKGDVQLIQSIPIDSASVLHLFHTVQGVVIVLGSSTTSKLSNNSGISVYRFEEIAEQFVLLRKIPSNGCTSAAGIVIGSDSLIVVGYNDGPIQVFKYHPKFDNYYFSQNIFTDTAVTGLSVFYGGNIGMSDSYLCIVTETGSFYIYSYRYIQGWKTLTSGEYEGLQILVPFKLGDAQYLFAASSKISVLLNVVKHGSN